MIDQLKPLFGKFTNFAQNKMGFDRPPRLFLKRDHENAKGCLGNTAHYDPRDGSITIFITNRHPKDILRSYAHELVHHTQNLRGDLTPKKCGQMTDKYAQENPHMRKMEEEAYLMGNMCFRDWEDNEKFTLQESKLLKENNNMTKKISRSDLKEMIAKIVSEKTKRAGHQVNGRPVPDDRVKPLEEKDLEEEERGEEELSPHADDDPDPDSRMPCGHESSLTPDAAAAGWGVGPMDLAGLNEEDLVNIIRDASARLAANEEGNEPVEENLEETTTHKDVLDAADDAVAATGAAAKKAATGGRAKNPGPKAPAATDARFDDNLFDDEGGDIGLEESDEINTPEKEDTLYEARFAKRNANLFEDLVKKWAK